LGAGGTSHARLQNLASAIKIWRAVTIQALIIDSSFNYQKHKKAISL
jgi:hypothetical protein